MSAKPLNSAGAASQLTLNRTHVFCSWAFGARCAGLRPALKRACVPMALDPEEIVTLLLLAALAIAWNWQTRALILLPCWYPSRIADARSMSRLLAVFSSAVPELTRSVDININV